MMKEQTPKIFISHNTKDTEYASAIVSMLITLGVKHNDIFCSSVKGYGIPFGKKIIDTLHTQFDDYKLFVIFIHSPRYYESVVSLNEMGAAWILRCEHRSFLTNDCDFSMLTGVINSDEIAFKVGQENTEHLLHDFRHDIKDFFSLDDIPDAVWETTKNEFIEKVKSLQYEALDEEPVKASIQKYVLDDADESESIIMEYMKNAGKDVRMNEISADTGLSVGQTRRVVLKLIQAGKIQRIGHVKYGKFRLL